MTTSPLTEATQLRSIAGGAFVAVFEGTGKARLVPAADTWPCSWLCEGVPPARRGDDEWYPDFPSDLIYECGAPTVGFTNGWACTAGHSHVSPTAQYFDDEEVDAWIRAGRPLPAGARLMDGTVIR